MISSPHISKPDSVSVIMLKVMLALLPGIALYVWCYGPVILVSIALASVTRRWVASTRVQTLP